MAPSITRRTKPAPRALPSRKPPHPQPEPDVHQAEPPAASDAPASDAPASEPVAEPAAEIAAAAGEPRRPKRPRPATEDAPAPEAALTAEGEEALAASGENNIIEVEEPASAENGEEVGRIRRRRRCTRRGAGTHAALPPLVQDPGGDQAPADHAGAGGEGGARHQGRGADHLSLARRPLFGADAEHRARRRHLAQDHQFARPQETEGDRAGPRSAGRHGRDPAHRGREPHQDRSEARLRISAAACGRRCATSRSSPPRRRWSTRKAR